MVMGRQPEAVMGIGSAVTASLSPVHLLASLLRDVQHTEDGTAENRPYCPPRGAGLAPGKRRGLWWTWQSADPQNPRGEAQGCREQTPCKAPQRKSRVFASPGSYQLFLCSSSPPPSIRKDPLRLIRAPPETIAKKCSL
ncbi:uncharacterized protein LOC115286558 isoform X5 [Suricata suricatta]|uniref:uncharacterized protein LOC115286558 isoform X5 n=1 Tax=Suricata suricatta TaxID=37032 RepID=UPI0011558D75|nr:uncharacterized protein LOC115286558 isoform X5 [Suricata suricatta]